jgi:tetratricopeptide (TPR) repeat protein
VTHAKSSKRGLKYVDGGDRELRIAALLLAIGVVLVYAQTGAHGFISYDDDRYVYANDIVKAGLTRRGVRWAITTFTAGNWHPVTWISHMLDCQFFGVLPGAHHLVNSGFHLGATLLLFLALARMTGRLWRSALVAGAFAIHPLHVESVAWIAERKDVLSTFLGMLAVLAYVRYTRRPGRVRLFVVCLLFGLALLAKPMLVSLPLVLLLLDYWPLGRIGWPPTRLDLRRLTMEKTPLFALSGAACVVALLAQRAAGAVAPLAELPPHERLANACVAVVVYLARCFWPAHLGVLYPYAKVSAAGLALAVALLIAITAVCVGSARQRPYLLVGWAWFVVMLIPVIGIVQVGVQSMADRYTYLPLVGLALAVIWGIGDLTSRQASLHRGAAIGGVLVLLILGALAYRQAEYWRDSRTLFEHTLAVTKGNYVIENNLGVVRAREGDRSGAVRDFQAALAIRPEYAEAHSNLGSLLAQSGQMQEAVSHLTEAVRLNPQYAEAQSNLCLALLQAGRNADAVPHCAEAVRLRRTRRRLDSA